MAKGAGVKVLHNMLGVVPGLGAAASLVRYLLGKSGGAADFASGSAGPSHGRRGKYKSSEHVVVGRRTHKTRKSFETRVMAKSGAACRRRVSKRNFARGFC